MPTELAPSQPMTTNQEKVTVTYMARTERRQNPSSSALISDDREPVGLDQQYLQGPAEAAALGSAKVPPVDAMVGGGAEVQGEEGEEGEGEESEVEKFITLAELTTNRLSDAGMWYIHCIIPQPAQFLTFILFGGGVHYYYLSCLSCRNERRAHIQKLLTRGTICPTLPEECGKTSRGKG